MDLGRRIRFEQTVDNMSDAFHVDALKKKGKLLLDKISNKVEKCSDKIVESGVYSGVMQATEKVESKVFDFTEKLVKKITK